MKSLSSIDSVHFNVSKNDIPKAPSMEQLSPISNDPVKKFTETNSHVQWRKYHSTSDLLKSNDLPRPLADCRASCENLSEAVSLPPSSIGTLSSNVFSTVSIPDQQHSIYSASTQRVAFSDVRDKLELLFSKRQTDNTRVKQTLNGLPEIISGSAIDPQVRDIKNVDISPDEEKRYAVMDDQDNVDPVAAPTNFCQSRVSFKQSASNFAASVSEDPFAALSTKQIHPLLEDESCSGGFQNPDPNGQEDTESGIYLETYCRESAEKQHDKQDSYDKQKREEEADDFLWCVKILSPISIFI
ncbi:hypothetical protein PoB_006339900 [Plakobranchus ocellatus]|uniref:Uncharacterized protein n=1 Tax=Plakobranchus ocellatus TaxID=259542 RepID=A0AAV4CY79_9GAST|nr:hypothetical protein PoB_006339900 [Plakobranchus ocellatus]